METRRDIKNKSKFQYTVFGTLLKYHGFIQICDYACRDFLVLRCLLIYCRLDLGYVDLYFIHSPYNGDNVATYRQMMEFQKQGLIR